MPLAKIRPSIAKWTRKQETTKEYTTQSKRKRAKHPTLISFHAKETI